MLTSSAVDLGLLKSVVDRGFEPRSGQTKYYRIGMCCFSAEQASLRRESNDWLGIRMMCPTGNPTGHVGLVQGGPHHHFIEN